jgi:hypothetical protein
LQKKIIHIITILFIVTGCSATRNAGNGELSDNREEGKIIVDEVSGNNLTNRDFFITKGKISTRSESGKIALFFTMKYKNPDVYLISIRNRIGIEAMRMLITADTVLINDRINKTVLYGNKYHFERITGVPAELLKISIGDFITFKKEPDIVFDAVNKELDINDYYKGILIRSTIDVENKKAKKAIITTGSSNEFISLDYKRHRYDINKVPRCIKVYDFRKKLAIKINIDKYTAPWFGEIDFIPGTGYNIKPLL